MRSFSDHNDDLSQAARLADLAALLATCQEDASLVAPASFMARVVARQKLLSQLELLAEMIAVARTVELQPLIELKLSTLRITGLLDEADADLFASYRDQLRARTLSPAAFNALLHEYALPTEAETWHDPPWYDHLDRLLDGILQLDAPPPPRVSLSPEMIPYQATPLRILLDMIDRLALTSDDVFYDLGAGLGRVVLGMALMGTGQMKGVEIEPAYVEYALARGRDLNVTNASFVHADAAEVDYADGTVFFLYTPFKGATLRRVLAKLRAQARTRPVRICTYGPGTLEVQDQEWLTSDDDPARDIHYVTIFASMQPQQRIPLRRRRRR